MSFKKPIYLDYMATTPVDARVLESMLPYLGVDGDFGNPASKHAYGEAALRAVEKAREAVAETVGTTPEAIVFTSGATESDNLAILGAAQFYDRKGKHLITLETEHKAVLDSFKHLEKNGFEVTYLKPNPDGLLDLAALKAAIQPETILVSLMHVNNEIGVIQPIQAVGDFLKGRGIIFHVDAAQSIGRLKLDLTNLPVDLMSFSAHKAYGPKGIGALYVRQKPRIRLLPQSFGGGHEGGLRSGTLPTHQMVGMGEAFVLAERLREKEEARLLAYQQKILACVEKLPQVTVNGSVRQRIAGNVNLCFKGMAQDELLIHFHDFAISSASACTASRDAGSHVLKALGLSVADAQSAFRFSTGRFTTDDEIEKLLSVLSAI